jgi:probable HAF family extracellular repeat protein
MGLPMALQTGSAFAPRLTDSASPQPAAPKLKALEGVGDPSSQRTRRPRSNIVDLGPFFGEIHAINGAGMIVGSALCASPLGKTRAACLDLKSGKISQLDCGSDAASSACDVNTFGQIVGTVNGLPFSCEDDSLVPRLLPTLGGSRAAAFAINNAGHIVGESYIEGNRARRGFMFLCGDRLPRPLGTLGGRNSCARDINDFGQVVGWADVRGDGAQHAFIGMISDSGAMIDLRTLGGTHSRAAAVNAFGDVVGSSDVRGDAATHAFVYSNGALEDIGTLGGLHSDANDINSFGQVVGNSWTLGNDGTKHAFLFSGSRMLDLNELPEVSEAGWTALIDARAINDAGQVVGIGVREGERLTFLLSLSDEFTGGPG